MKKTMIVFAVLIGIGAIGNLLPDSGKEYTGISNEAQSQINACFKRTGDYESCYKGWSGK
jgi:hypothetical protein